MLAGSLLAIVLLNKNLYCDRICPFGAAQDGVNTIAGSRKQITLRWTRLKWIPRILALGIMVLGLLYQNPTRFNYEIYSVFFKLIGSVFQISLLSLVLLSSLFLVRPWCHLLCPVKPVLEWIRMMRNWILAPAKNKKS